MTRVRVTGGPWPERIGCEGVTVPDPGDGIYPFSRLPKSEVIILLDADPLLRDDRPDCSWTCCIGRSSVETIG